MNYYTVPHCHGDKAIPVEVKAEIAAVISSISVKPRAGAASKVRDAFLSSLKAHGWSGEFQVSVASDMTITSLKGQVGLCLQTGNMARMYADLIKLQTLYLDGAITSAIFVVPSRPMAVKLGSNVAEANRLERELKIFTKAYHVPTLVYALE
ncbi:MAG: hypothetical protein J0J01_29760 [Reyranella sp.]|uniref:BglII/BstYI family type II restriction endonuclease n=1 Tax=Reyranella sp. TaxID=1929291 RepID=UPI001AD547B7|nr:BglII/BstYI family type II restriction endonuclease [Reyranella sp.]MBN9091123.1 hypothetical protein [Reyranella sp.]